MLFRDLKETSIMWDKRVHRGSTYSMYTQNAIKEALEKAVQPPSSPVPRPRRKPKEQSIFDMPAPEEERMPVDLTAHLVAKSEAEVVRTETVEAQTDEFLPEPPPEQYLPQKTGVDVHTQVEEGELFNFDYEVEPILDVIVNKTLEQSLMEVEEEYELAQMQDFKTQWYKRQEKMMADWEAQVEEERVRWRQKEELLQMKREEKQREARVLLKMQALAASRRHLAGLVPSAVRSLGEAALPDARAMAITRLVLPDLFGQVQKDVGERAQATRLVDQMAASQMKACLTRRREGLAAQRERHKELAALHLEEKQIRRGKITILIDKDSGEQVRVGPVQIAAEDKIEDVNAHLVDWLQEHEPDLASAWRWGVMLCVDGEPVQETAHIFAAGPGQISMVPKPEPPPTPQEDEEEEDDEEGEDEEEDED